jgi:hypothetical protein
MGIIADTLKQRLAELQETDKRSQQETEMLLMQISALMHDLQNLDLDFTGPEFSELD